MPGGSVAVPAMAGTPSTQIGRSGSVAAMIFDISCHGPVLVPSGTVSATRTERSTAR